MGFGELKVQDEMVKPHRWCIKKYAEKKQGEF